jgi:adenylate cyclase
MRFIDKLKQKTIPIISGLCIVAAAFFFEISNDINVSTVRERLNSIIYDVRMRVALMSRGPIDPSQSDVVIVDIDEKSLDAEGRWPWPRDKVAMLLDKLRKAGAVVVAFDVVFAEKQENLAEEMLSELAQDKINAPALETNIQQYKKLFDYDQEFADTIAKGTDVVLGYILTAEATDNVGLLPPPLVSMDKNQQTRVELNNLPGQIANIAILQESAKHGGFVTTLTDYDGIIRHSSIVMAHKDGIYPSLGMAAVMQYYYVDTAKMNFVDENNNLVLTHVTLGNTQVPTDAYGQVLVPYKGQSQTFPYVSASDVIQEKADPNLIKNKIAFVGTSALGLGDLHATPFESSYPGVEIHATIADALLHSSFLSIPDWALGAKVFVIVSVGLILTFLLPFLSVLWVVIVPVLVSVAIGTGSILMYTTHNIYISSITIYLLTGSLVIANVLYGFVFESRKRLQLKEMFGQYVPPAHVEKMSESAAQYSFEGESRDMSVLFADIRNFTHISEHLDPAQLKKLLNDYFTPMTQIIFDNGGTIDKYVGDMIMAFWGAPLENKHHALDAVKTGFGMHKMAEIMSEQFKDLNVGEIRIGVGVNSGFMNVGDMGSKYRRSYTVLGDTVNLASRLESSTKFYHANFIISENTLLDCKGEVIARHLDRVKVIGKDTAVEIYQPLCLKGEETEEIRKELESLALAEKMYYAARWDDALHAYEDLQAQYPDVGLYELYIERIKELKEKGTTAPWDGCYVRVSK